MSEYNAHLKFWGVIMEQRMPLPVCVCILNFFHGSLAHQEHLGIKLHQNIILNFTSNVET